MPHAMTPTVTCPRPAVGSGKSSRDTVSGPFQTAARTRCPASCSCAEVVACRPRSRERSRWFVVDFSSTGVAVAPRSPGGPPFRRIECGRRRQSGLASHADSTHHALLVACSADGAMEKAPTNGHHPMIKRIRQLLGSVGRCFDRQTRACDCQPTVFWVRRGPDDRYSPSPMWLLDPPTRGRSAIEGIVRPQRRSFTGVTHCGATSPNRHR
jgi:hypothetical protein